MAADPNNETVIARFLLGDLTEEQQIEIEDRAFADKEYLATITAVENDLIDEYVRDEMPAADRLKFESRFLASADRRKRVKFAKALATVTSESVVPEKVAPKPAVSWRESLENFFGSLNPLAKIAVAAAMLMVLVGGAWLLTEILRLRMQLTQLQAEDKSRQNDRQSLEQQVEAERRRNEELTASLNQEKQQREQTDESLRQLTEARESTPAPQSIIATLTLLPGISRGAGEKPKLALAEDVRVVRLRVGIDADEEYKNFAVEMRSSGGRQVWNRENLRVTSKGGARAIGLTVPAMVLKPGEYELRLIGVAEGGGREDLGFYYFDVTKR